MSVEVSVVIPTFGRPDMVVEAVGSALAQEGPSLEVIVVIDGDGSAGSGPQTAAALARIDDPRLSVLNPARRLGNAAARNAGIAAARGRWIALLDDDDLWLPGKLRAQLAAADASGFASPIVSCRFLARHDAAEFVWPRHLPAPGQHVSEYLFCRRSPATGDGAVQTSTVLAPAEIFARVSFDPECRRFVDMDWLLRAMRAPDTGLVFAAPEAPLSVWRMDDRLRISLQGGWRDDVAWIEARRHLVTPRAHAAFLLTLPSIRATREGDRRAAWTLLRAAFRAGRPGWAEIAFHLAGFGLPRGLAHALVRRKARPPSKHPPSKG